MIQLEGALGWITESSEHRMGSFPGSIYNGQGRSLDPTVPDLAQLQIDACLHRSLVTDRDLAPIIRVWLLMNDAAPDAIRHILMIEATRLVLAEAIKRF